MLIEWQSLLGSRSYHSVHAPWIRLWCSYFILHSRSLLPPNRRPICLHSLDHRIYVFYAPPPRQLRLS